MSRETHNGKLSALRIHREIGYGPPDDHIRVHCIVRLDSNTDKEFGFPIREDGDRLVHQSWVEMLTSAFTHNHRLLVESDFDTERGTHGVIRTLTLTRE